MTKKRHICLFKHIAGGCDTGNTKEAKKNLCDDHYRCECGLEFRIYSTRKVHFELPAEIVGRVRK